MKECENQLFCGGCVSRELEQNIYQARKEADVKAVLRKIKQENLVYDDTIFIPDGTRRRTTLAFAYSRGTIKIGYNQQQSHEIVDCYKCLLLTKKINANLLNIRDLLDALCQIPFVSKEKKKITTSYLQNGDVHICEADNGLDVVLEFDKELSLEHKLTICERSQKYVDVIRISHRRKPDFIPEVLIEKAKPCINISGCEVFIPAGTFLQASKMAQDALIAKVMEYVGDTQGRCLDLFCGVGTFSYPLAKNIKNKVTSVDSSRELLDAFQKSVNASMIPNINVVCKNLFKYPLSGDELKNYEVMIFDPPRAGASAQVKELQKLSQTETPNKIIAVSCNPQTFVNDANILLDCGYKINRIAIIDQFIYSPHAEVVALFEK